MPNPVLQFNTLDMNKQLYINYRGMNLTCEPAGGDNEGYPTNQEADNGYCAHHSIYIWGVQLEKIDTTSSITPSIDVNTDTIFEPSNYKPKYGGDFKITYKFKDGYGEESVLPFGIDFFWPDTDL